MSKFMAAIGLVGFVQTLQGIWQAVWPYLPIVWGAVTGGAGFVTGVPLMQIMVYSAAGAAFVFMAILFASLQLERKNPENKLTVVGPMVGIDYVKQKSSNAARRIERAQWMFAIRNDAPFPISIIIESAETEIEELKPPRAKYPKSPVLLGARGLLNIMDDPIDLRGRQCGNFVGEADFTVKYGYPGKERFVLRIKGAMLAAMLANGGVTSVTLSHAI
jgi:hypothetical protein